MASSANRRPTYLLLAVAAVVVLLLVLLVPDADSAPASDRYEAESGAALVVVAKPGGVPEGVTENTSGVTTPPNPQPATDFSRLTQGQQPPQFVVVSFDGGVESRTGILRHYLDLAERVNGRFSLFVSGVFLLPDDQTKLSYNPPGRSRGSSDIGFGDPEIMQTRIDTMAEAYTKGHEIGTHYNGHFCGPGGVASWSTADWTSEIKQFNTILDNWRGFNPGAASAGPLPFDSSAIKGGRTPCLEGNRPAMYKAFADAGYKYDTSNPGKLEWPEQKEGLWDIPLQAIKVPGQGKTGILSMDYNLLVNQNEGKIDAPESRCQEIEDNTYQAYSNALDAVRGGNRAPLILGNHMNNWVCGAYTKALTRFVDDTHAKYPDVRFISTMDLVTWMNEQDPAVMAELIKRPVQTQ